MNSLTAFLGTLAVLSFLMGAAGFVTLVWRVSWGVRGFVETEQKRAEIENAIAELVRDFVATQRETNEQVWTAIQVQADRLNRLLEGEPKQTTP